MIFVAKTGVWPICFATYLTSGRKKDHVRAAAAISQEVCAQLFFPLAMSCPVTNDGDHKSTKSKGS